MKIAFVADPHGFLNQIDIPPADVLAFPGDLTMEGTAQQILKFNHQLGKLPFPKEKILICPGNHDMLFEKDPALAKSFITNGTYLQDEEIIINGIKFYFSPASPTFFNWAFNYDRGDEIKKVWAKIPDDCDILVTHGPPQNILDEVRRDLGISWEFGRSGNEESRDFGYRTEHAGCYDLMEQIKKIKPKYHVFGHIHAHGGQKVTLDETTFINASVCNERYDPVNPVIVVEF